MRCIRKVDNFNRFIESKFEFKETLDSLQLESDCYKEFFPSYKHLVDFAVFCISMVFFIYIAFFLENNPKIVHFLVPSLIIIFIVLYIFYNKKDESILLNFAPDGITVGTKSKPDSFFIDILNIEDIYPNIITLEKSRQGLKAFEKKADYVRGYAVVLKCKKSIFLNLKGYKDEFVLLECLTEETYKNIIKDKIKLMKKYLNLYDDKKDYDSLNNFNLKDHIFFKRNEKKFEILVSTGSDFFQSKSKTELRKGLGNIISFIALIVFCGALGIFFNILIFSIVILTILSVIYLYLRNFKKILFRFSSNGLEVNYGKQFFSIKKGDIDSVYFINNIEEISEKLRRENIIDSDSTFDIPTSYKVVLKTKNKISLLPIVNIVKNEFTLFELDIEYKDIVCLLTNEIKKMLDI